MLPQLALATLLVLSLSGRAAAGAPDSPAATPSPADQILSALSNDVIRGVVADVLGRNPDLARLAAASAAADQRPEQARSLADPVFGVTAYLAPPQTRVGPQRFMASIAQQFPLAGKLATRGRAAEIDAEIAAQLLEAKRLDLITRTRRLLAEIAFVDSSVEITTLDRDTLSHYEELSNARYASGVGIQQAVIKLQAEITKDEATLLDLSMRRARLVAQVNGLRARDSAAVIPTLRVADTPSLDLDRAALRRTALARRPDLLAAELATQRAAVIKELANKDYTPDLTLGLAYTMVDRRSDPAGVMSPPQGNGRDIVALSGAINLPVRRERRTAAVQEAVQREIEAEAGRAALVTQLDAALDDLTQRIPLLERQINLYDTVLLAQASEALRSAESAYAAGTIGALDLLDAERVLLTARLSAARASSDLRAEWATLEGTVAAPVASTHSTVGGTR